MDFKQLLETIAAGYGWGVVYARRDYQNLQDILDRINSEAENYAEGETFLFVDPMQRKRHSTGYTYSGRFMVLTNADLADDYATKYAQYIAPIIDIVMNKIPNKLRCDGDVEQWQSIEVINALDINGDGLSVTYQWKGEGFPAYTLPPAQLIVSGVDNYNGTIIIQEEGLAGQQVQVVVTNGVGPLVFADGGPPAGFREGYTYPDVNVPDFNGRSYQVAAGVTPISFYKGKSFRLQIEDTGPAGGEE